MGSNPIEGTLGEIWVLGYRRDMISANPVLSRYDKPKGAGFAYDEGRSAFASAQGAPTTAVSAPPAGSDTDFAMVTAAGGARVTMADVIVKTAIVFGISVFFAVIGWNLAQTMPMLAWIGMGGALVLGLINAFKKQISPPLVIGYAIASGIMLGSISYFYNQIGLANEYEGLVLQAVIGTMTAFGVMLFLFGTGIIKVTGKFMKVMIAAMVSYLIIALASFVGALMGVGGGWGFYGVSGWGLLLAAAGVLLASFALLIDFEYIRQGIAQGLPERESWRMAFGLLITLVWLYLEILRFLTILASGRD
jgi:uncharacterized YccA/Bax inhibitor family protein